MIRSYVGYNTHKYKEDNSIIFQSNLDTITCTRSNQILVYILICVG